MEDLPHLYRHPEEVDPDNPFANDQLERAALAKKLTGMINRLPEGAVFAIDAPWGDGKSWFGKNWHANLSFDGYKSIYIDTFASDYMEDPFILLTGEISQNLESIDKNELKAQGTKVVKALMPVVAKVTLNLVGKVLGTSDIAGEFGDAIEGASEGASESAENFIANKIANYDKEKNELATFKKSLASIALVQFQKTNKPIVIFIDELDRCKPDFAVKTIERIKHFFDVKHLIFVLLLNTKQIHESIRGVYGQKIDAERYLGKFIQFSLTLPRPYNKNRELPYYRFSKQKLEEYKFPQGTSWIENMATSLAECGRAFSLTLRDIERCIILLSLNVNRDLKTNMLAFGVSFKISENNAYRDFLDENFTNPEPSIDIIRRLNQNDFGDFKGAIEKAHNQIKSKSAPDANDINHYAYHIGTRSRRPLEEIIAYYESLNIKID